MIARKPQKPLSGKQRSHLRSLAHHLDPTVQIGKEGLSDGVAAAVREALARHELIKVRVLETCELDREALAAPLAEATGSHVVGGVGRVVMLYRMHDEQPTIVLPRR